MKKLLLGLALLGLGAACRSSGAGMHDSSCTGPDCTDCTKEQMENCSDCKEKTECKEGAEGAVCPVTGKAMN
ncbi:MAG: hypothetical protein ABL998_10310 [Planctomycetota bacterium]